MSARTAPRRTAVLTEQLETLRSLVDRAPGRLPDELVARADDTLRRADARLSHGSAHTVVAIAGATGSGKSSLFNALVGAPLADVGVRRPTTATAQAAIFGGGADRLLDWLDVPTRHVVDAGSLDGLVLLDLPDHDSVETAHRQEVDRLVGVVDAFIWVVDPQKYADDALHRHYLSRFANHGAVSIVVVNQIDTIPLEQDRRAVLEHVAALLVEDGLTGVRTIATSMRTGDGTDALRRELIAKVAARHALVARLSADIDWLVDDLRAAVGDVTPRSLSRAERHRLEEAFAHAAGVDGVADAVGAAHRHRSAQRAGWPPVRWIGRLRPDPLRRLGLDRRGPRQADRSEHDGAIGRTSRTRPTAVAEVVVDQAVREVALDATAGLPERWHERVRRVAAARRDDAADALDVAVAGADLRTHEPRWWAIASAAQWCFTAAMVTGLAWLTAIGVVAWLQLPELPTPDVGVLELPTLLTLVGAAGGWIVAFLGRRAAAIGGRRRAARARRALMARTSDVARTLVIEPVDAELAAFAELQELARRLDR
jgi:GTP-binding protein EngB required for normal cell division